MNSKNTQIKRYSVILGKNAINETNPVKEQQFKVSKLVVHEDFDYTTENYTHDIGKYALYFNIIFYYLPYIVLFKQLKMQITSFSPVEDREQRWSMRSEDRICENCMPSTFPAEASHWILLWDCRLWKASKG